jgi:hypothetical protein
MDIKQTLANIRKNIEEGNYPKHPRQASTSTEPSVRDLAEEEMRNEERNCKYYHDAQMELI